MELWAELVVVQEINLITNEVMEKRINPVPSSIMFHLQFC